MCVSTTFLDIVIPRHQTHLILYVAYIIIVMHILQQLFLLLMVVLKRTTQFDSKTQRLLSVWKL